MASPDHPRCDESADTAAKEPFGEPGTATRGGISSGVPSASSTSGPVPHAVVDPRIVFVPDVLGKIARDQTLIGKNAERLGKAIADAEIVKTCPRCKERYNGTAWEALPLVNRLPEHALVPGADPGPMVQIRACPCGLALSLIEPHPDRLSELIETIGAFHKEYGSMCRGILTYDRIIELAGVEDQDDS